MPAVGTRRSTRVFVPKATKPAKGVRRSGDRPSFSDSHWPKDAFHHKPPPAPPTRSFGIVYIRKRKRKLPAEPKHDDARFGIVFTRKDKRPKVAPSLHDKPSYIPCSSSSSREFVSRIGFLDANPSTLVDDGVATAALLVVLVDTSCSGSSHHFLRLLLPVLRWMRHHSQRSKLRNLASFLSSAAVATVFASLGLHFIKLWRWRTSSSLQRTMVHCRWCELRDANQSRPVLSVNFSALPSYFQSLHSMIALRSIYLPAKFRRSIGLVGRAEEMYPRDALEADSWSLSTLDAEPAVDLRCNEARRVFQDYVPPKQVAGSVMHALRLKKHKRKRSSMRRPVNRRRLAARFPEMAIGMKQGTMTSQTELKPALALTGPEVSVEPFQPKPAFDISLDLLENMDDSDVSTPMRSNGKQKGYSFKSPIEHTNEKLHLSEVRQNIDSFLCKVNILIIQADWCWREEGAVVMLELSNCNGWCIAVKLNGVTRFSLKPSEQRFYVVNRVNHAYIWAVEDGWKLEFSDKSDWL